MMLLGMVLSAAAYFPAFNAMTAWGNPGLVAAVEAACTYLGLPYRPLPSGAGHDAMVIGEFTPQAMVFVPSRGGISHSPEEFTEPERCLDGGRVLLRALIELDERLDAAVS